MHQLAEQLTDRGHALRVLADHRPKEAVAERAFDSSQPFVVDRVGGPRPWRRRRKGARAVRLSEGLGATIIADSWKSVECLPRRIKAPIICLAHGSEFPVGNQGGKIGRILSRTNAIVANSRYTASLVERTLGDSSRIRIIPPGLNAPPALGERALAGSAALFEGEGPHLVSMGRLIPRKGFFSILRALPGLLGKFPKLRWHIVGVGESRLGLEALAGHLGIAGHVVFHGARFGAEKLGMLACADLFVLPGFREGKEVEGFGIVFTEAAAMGLPCVAGADGGSGDAVLDGQTGVLCDAGIQRR